MKPWGNRPSTGSSFALGLPSEPRGERDERAQRRRAGFDRSVLTMLTAPAAAAGMVGSGDESAGGGGESTGSIYSDLVVALRAENGTPILKKYVIPATEEAEETTEFCVQPVAYEPVPGVAASVNPLDGRQVWVLPLQGEWIGSSEPLPVEEIEACDPKPQYAMFVEEAELERLNLARTSDDVLERKLLAVEEKLLAADDITLDGAGRITTDGSSLDASPEFAAMYSSLTRTGTIPGLPPSMAGPPAQVGVFDAWKLAAAAIGTAAGKEVPITVDTVEYYNRVIGFPATGNYVSPWGVDFIRSENPDDPGGQMATGERFVDFSGFTYNRSETFRGSVTWLDVPSMTWKVDRITDVVSFTQLTAEPVGTRTLSGVTAFAQLADDVRAVILYYHEHETIPGFYIDPVGVDTTAAQEQAIHDPAVSVVVPVDAFRTESFPMTTTSFNPWGGTDLTGVRLRVTIDAPADLDVGDLSVAPAAGGTPMVLESVGGDLVGWWGPEAGDPLARGQLVPTTFDVVATSDAPAGDYGVSVELVDVTAEPDAVLAADADSVRIREAVPTVLWADEIYPLVTQGEPFQVPVTVYSPVDGDADLHVTLTGPGDDPGTLEIEQLQAGDARAYASDGTDMVAMPLAIDGTDVLAGDWSQPLTAGRNLVTWYVTIAEGAPVGSYSIGVSLAGGNTLDPAVVSVAAPEQHGNHDTTPPVVTITVVGELGSDATFTLSANEEDVVYQCRLVKNDVPGAWGECDETGVTYTGLSPGVYSFHVKGTDAAGNVSHTFFKTWTVVPVEEDATAPETTLVDGPTDQSWVLAHRVGIDVDSDDPSAAFIVTLNDRFVGTFKKGHILVKGVRAGANEITVRAVAGGLTDLTPVELTVFVPRGVSGVGQTHRWRIREGDGHLFGHFAQTRRHGEEVRFSVRRMTRLALVVSTGPSYGKIKVLVDGKPVSRRISLASAAATGKVLIPIRTFGKPRSGVVTVKVVSPNGEIVRLEGIGVVTG